MKNLQILISCWLTILVDLQRALVKWLTGQGASHPGRAVAKSCLQRCLILARNQHHVLFPGARVNHPKEVPPRPNLLTER